MMQAEAFVDVELLTREGLRAELIESEERAQRRIPTYKRVAGAGVMPASGTLTIAIGGPPVGKWWDVRRVVITPADVTTTGLSTAIGIVFVGQPPQNPSNLNAFEAVEATTGLPATFYVAGGQCPVVGTERLWVAIPSGPAANTAFTATALVIEFDANKPAETTQGIA